MRCRNKDIRRMKESALAVKEREREIKGFERKEKEIKNVRI